MNSCPIENLSKGSFGTKSSEMHHFIKACNRFMYRTIV